MGWSRYEILESWYEAGKSILNCCDSLLCQTKTRLHLYYFYVKSRMNAN